MSSIRKRLFSILLSFMFICTTLSGAWAEETEGPAPESETVEETEDLLKLWPEDEISTDEVKIYSRAGIVMDAQTGDVLYYKNPDTAKYPASITKLMTTYIGMTESAPDEVLTISQEAIDHISSDSSQLGLPAGQTITMEEALYSLMVVSANDVANAVAEHVSGSIDDFVRLMNYYTKVLGLNHTHFANPHGLHEADHRMSVYDAALIARACYQVPAFRDYCSANLYTFTSEINRTEAEIEKLKKENNGEIPEYKIYSHHKMVNNSYPYTYAIGGKTGYTKEARNCLATYASDGTHTLICVVFDCPGGGQNYLYKDTENLFEYCFKNYAKAKKASNRCAGTILHAVPYNMNLCNDSVQRRVGFDLERLRDIDSEAILASPTLADYHLVNFLIYDKQRYISLTQKDRGEDLTFTEGFIHLIDITENDRKSNDEIIVGILIIALCVICGLLILTWLFRLSRRKYKRLHYKSMKRRRKRAESETSRHQDL